VAVTSVRRRRWWWWSLWLGLRSGLENKGCCHVEFKDSHKLLRRHHLRRPLVTATRHL
jgi:hypothetical protein